MAIEVVERGVAMGKQVVLVVDSDPAVQRLLRVTLSARWFAVMAADSLQSARVAWQRCEPDLVLLERMLPDGDGLDWLQEIRVHSSVPVIVVSARATPEERVAGLEYGADDYVAKPFHLDELMARIRAVLRRSQKEYPTSGVLQYDRVTIDLVNRRVYVDGEEVRLSRTEWALLEQLARSPGRVVKHTELLTHVWGPEFARETYYLRTWVSRLRSKLRDEEEPHRVIVTRPGLGYQLAEPPVLAAVVQP